MLAIIILAVVTMVEAGALYKNRVSGGVDDVSNEFPYVVSLQTNKTLIWGEEVHRACTGTLIAPEWVLTAGHCLLPSITIVRYGNMTVSRNSTDSMRKILKRIPHPSFLKADYFMKNDIGLLLTEKISMPTMGKVSAIDYKTLTGLKVRYAGFGLISDQILDEVKPLQLGEGLVIPCSHDPNFWCPAICIVAECTNRYHDSERGDSGGPVFHNGKIVAIVSGALTSEGIYTPVGLYIDWIRDTMNGHKDSL